MDMPTGSAPAGPGYDRRLGTFDATMVVVGAIVGAGIFLNPAIVAQRVGSSGAVLAAWVLGGAIAVVGALCFAELGAR
ncbi:MAG: amino acid permease, partial [Gemmatimonadota bacterium]